ncbi:MAG TPA: hypothetical protein VMN58_01105 [Acidimicrobiales bacterium]|nr:hypothetical protein [Acidimicrobiales bacterium]
MSGGLAFLVVAMLLSILGSFVLWLRHRKPTSLEHGIDSFSREMGALAPGREQRASRGPGQAGDDTGQR